MRLFYKYIQKQILKDKIFVLFLGILTILTPFSYFFVMFSIDGNLAYLNSLQTLTENQILYRNALLSNTRLANIFLLSTASVTAGVFAMFYYRIIRANQVKLGALLAIGFKPKEIRRGYALFAILSGLIHGMLGIVAGYFCADLLVNANKRSYAVTGLVKQISMKSMLIGLAMPVIAYLAVCSLVVYIMLKNKESAILMNGKRHSKRNGVFFRMISKFVDHLFVKEKFPYRIALRKPVSVIIMVLAILVFSVFILLGQSLSWNGQQVMRIQQSSGSYHVSAMICQITGVLSGVLLLFLALFLNFQDNKQDMQVLRLLGYQNCQIQKLFVNVYWNILMSLFLLCLLPGIWIAKGVLKSLSMAIEEHMTFYMDVSNLLLLAVLWNIVYLCVKGVFMLQVRKMKQIE